MKNKGTRLPDSSSFSRAFSTTSNSVAGEILWNAGIPYNFPSCAWGADNPLSPIPFFGIPVVPYPFI